MSEGATASTVGVVRSEVERGSAWLTLDNPRRLNAMTLSMMATIPALLAELDSDPAVNVVIVRGAGGRAFSTGADVSEFETVRSTVEQRAVYSATNDAMVEAWRKFSKPIIAMVQGYCVGGGMVLAMYADLRISAASSTFGVPAARLGLGYPYVEIERLARIVGASWSAEILYTGRRLSATEALTAGLVNRVVPDEDLVTTIADVASLIAANAPLTVRACKAGIRETQKDPADRDIDRIDELTELCFRSEDYREGQRAFLEKRAPDFRGL